MRTNSSDKRESCVISFCDLTGFSRQLTFNIQKLERQEFLQHEEQSHTPQPHCVYCPVISNVHV